MCAPTLDVTAAIAPSLPSPRLGDTIVARFFFSSAAVKQLSKLSRVHRETIAAALARGIRPEELSPVKSQKKHHVYRRKFGDVRVLLRLRGSEGLIELIDQRDAAYDADYRPSAWESAIPAAEALKNIHLAQPSNTQDTEMKRSPNSTRPSLAENSTSNEDTQFLAAFRKAIGVCIDGNNTALVEMIHGDLDAQRAKLDDFCEASSGLMRDLMADLNGFKSEVRAALDAHAQNGQSHVAALAQREDDLRQTVEQVQRLSERVDELSGVVEQSLAGLQGAQQATAEVADSHRRLEERQDALDASIAGQAGLESKLRDVWSSLQAESLAAMGGLKSDVEDRFRDELEKHVSLQQAMTASFAEQATAISRLRDELFTMCRELASERKTRQELEEAVWAIRDELSARPQGNLLLRIKSLAVGSLLNRKLQ